MSLVSLVVVALVLLLSALGVLAVVMVRSTHERECPGTRLISVDVEKFRAWEAEFKWPRYEPVSDAHGALLGSVESEKHRLIAGAMKADREAALKRIGGDA